jgi:hypothetical protein
MLVSAEALASALASVFAQVLASVQVLVFALTLVYLFWSVWKFFWVLKCVLA